MDVQGAEIEMAHLSGQNGGLEGFQIPHFTHPDDRRCPAKICPNAFGIVGNVSTYLQLRRGQYIPWTRENEFDRVFDRGHLAVRIGVQAKAVDSGRLGTFTRSRDSTNES
ncbi:hypothetical protein ALP00_200155 [Pseudomonas coronafaciens pv. porri]|nr:hypothetical protein ALP00_200155 [Pseudomonas coronafaciens pv. porri]